jgi:predicted RNA binding protein YcfA (HicA-like mRNA interferase family)
MNEKVYKAVMGGISDNNIKYADFQNLVVDLGFVFQRQEGSHAIYRHMACRANMNIQPDGSKAKGYQVRQLRGLIKKFDLKEDWQYAEIFNLDPI